MPRKFHLGDVLSVATYRVVAPAGIEGIRKILEFMTNDMVFASQISRFLEECKPHLLKQYPQFASPQIDPDLADLDRLLKTVKPSARRRTAMAWLRRMVAKHGEFLSVKRIPARSHMRRNAVAELMEQKDCDVEVIVLDK